MFRLIRNQVKPRTVSSRDAIFVYHFLPSLIKQLAIRHTGMETCSRTTIDHSFLRKTIYIWQSGLFYDVSDLYHYSEVLIRGSCSTW